MNVLYKKSNIIEKMKNWKNIAKFLLCAFALSGLVACAGGGGGGGTDPSSSCNCRHIRSQ